VDITDQWTIRGACKLKGEFKLVQRSAAMDTQGNLHGMLVEEASAKGNRRFHLHYFQMTRDGDMKAQQRLEMPEGQPWIVSRSAANMRLGPDGLPVVAFSRILPGPNTYNLELILGRRDATGRWHYESLGTTGNVGHWPVMCLDGRGDVESIYHFDYHRIRLLKTSRSSNDQPSWETKAIGVRGDGWSMIGPFRVAGKDAIWFHHNPANLPTIFHLAWEADDGELMRVADPRLSGPITQDDGEGLWAFGKEFDGQRLVGYLYRLVNNRWQAEFRLPIHNLKSTGFVQLNAHDDPLLTVDQGKTMFFIRPPADQKDPLRVESLNHGRIDGRANSFPPSLIFDTSGNTFLLATKIEQVQPGQFQTAITLLGPK